MSPLWRSNSIPILIQEKEEPLSSGIEAAGKQSNIPVAKREKKSISYQLFTARGTGSGDIDINFFIDFFSLSLSHKHRLSKKPEFQGRYLKNIWYLGH
ncbi:hypothetical protein TNIN_478301 [Trichonephila inaurata madagascariensis]|uniref:Uncharacterized protein n=1 Tax=Trichonephila inaurata madagascariensis TaxID=2747483 RepID=A0A8X6YKU5_9ARAC|nr:hypothetical protein TNIN_478301 [Trichonephila inaurata madagascariensis]